jgi:hypothetical protein
MFLPSDFFGSEINFIRNNKFPYVFHIDDNDQNCEVILEEFKSIDFSLCTEIASSVQQHGSAYSLELESDSEYLLQKLFVFLFDITFFRFQDHFDDFGAIVTPLISMKIETKSFAHYIHGV